MQAAIVLPISTAMFKWLVDPQRPFSVQSLQPDIDSALVVSPMKCYQQYEDAANNGCKEAKHYMEHPFGYKFIVAIRDNSEAGVKAIMFYAEE